MDAWQAWVRPGERLEDLQRDNLRILQKERGFRFGTDSVLLASFAAARASSGLAADLGTGSGILPLLICARRKNITFDAIEIQPDMADMAGRSVCLCGLSDRIRVHAMDLRDAPGALGHGRYSLVVCNPPYGERGGALDNPEPARSVARHEGETDIADICRAAGALLRNGGRFCLVFPAHRLLHLCDALRAARVEPKRVMMVHPGPDKPPNLLLMEGVRGAKPMLHFQPPVVVRDGRGNITDAVRRMYSD